MKKKNSGIPRSVSDTLQASAWLCVLLQIGIGIYLAKSYSATTANAYKTAHALGPLASFHYYASAITIALFGLALLSMLWNGEHRWDSRWKWWVGILGLLVVVGIQITGNLLPLSAHDVKTANVEANIAASAPAVGSTLRYLALQGDEFSQSTLSAWYLLHRIVLPLTAVLLLCAFLVASWRRTARPAWLWAAVPVAAAAMAAITLGSPPDIAATPDDFTQGGTRPMWYVAPMHVLLLASQKLSHGAGWIGAMAVPAIGILILLALPFLMRKGNGPSSGIRAITLLAILSFIGLCAWTKPRIQNPLSELTGESSQRSNGGHVIDVAMAKKGRGLFMREQCLGCHRVGAEGTAVGPNLTRVGARFKDPQWYVDLLKDPSSKSRDSMPAFDSLKKDEARAIAEYLLSLK